MAEVIDDSPAVTEVVDLIPNENHVTHTTQYDGSVIEAKTKRWSKFRRADDIILLHDVVVESAHVKYHGKKGERIASTKEATSKNPL